MSFLPHSSHAGGDSATTTTARPPRWSDLTQARLQPTGEAPSQELFGRAVAALLESRGIGATQCAFDLLHALAEQYLETLVAELARAARVQRRTTPGASDCLVLLRLMGLNAGLLEDEREAEQRFPTILPDAWTEIELGMLPTVEHDSSELFSTAGGSSTDISGQQHQQRRLVPSRKDRGKHIPDWMPEFPPDHTFMTTSSLPDRVTDPRALREMIVQEGQLAEHALRRLTGVIRVDENAATNDEDDEPAIHDDTTTTAPAATTNGDHSSDESKGLEAKLPKGLIGLGSSSTAEPVSLSAVARDEDRASATATSSDSTTMSRPMPNGTNANGASAADATTTPASTANSADDDPFNIKRYRPTSKRFDIVEYAHSKRRKQQKPLATSAAAAATAAGANGGTKNNTSNLLRDNSPAAVHARAERFYWQRSLASASRASNSTAGPALDAETLEIIDHEDRDPAGLGAAISLVEHEYNVALAKIQRSKDPEAKKESIVDTGIVNWERDRFLWA